MTTTTDLLRRAAEVYEALADPGRAVCGSVKDFRADAASLLALADSLERAEPVALMLRRKRDGFVRACYSEAPSTLSLQIADQDGDEYILLYTRPAPEVTRDVEPVYTARWNHGCNALCTEIDLWVNRCPHCGKPAPQAAMQEPKP